MATSKAPDDHGPRRPHTELRRNPATLDVAEDGDTSKAGATSLRPRAKHIPEDGRDIDGDDLFNDMPV